MRHRRSMGWQARTGRWRARWRALPLVRRDGIGAAALVVLVAVEVAFSWPTGVGTAVVDVLAVLATATLTWRRARPFVALVVTGAVAVADAATPGAGSGIVLAALVAVYSAVAWARRGLALAAAALECAAVTVPTAARSDQSTGTVVALVVAVYAIAVALGLASSSRRTVVEAARERAVRAEQTRELEAARRVAQERLRIARELHDVIGHHVAVVGVQAAVASRLLESRPDDARTALEHVQDASETVLAELGALVRVLREPGEEVPAGPAPGLDRLDALLDEARTAGLDVVATTTGRRRALPPVVDLAAYRVVQESLTNARKHGTGTARVTIDYGPDALGLTTTNRAGRAAEQGGGFGLVGLRERVAAVGGVLAAGTSDGSFVLTARLPLPHADQEDA